MSERVGRQTVVRVVVGFALVLCVAGVLVAGVQVADAQETIVVDKRGWR